MWPVAIIEFYSRHIHAEWAIIKNVYTVFIIKIKPKPDYPLKTLYPRAFQTGLNRLIYYDFTTVE